MTHIYMTHHPQHGEISLYAAMDLRLGEFCWIAEDGGVYPILFGQGAPPLPDTIGIADAWYLANAPVGLYVQRLAREPLNRRPSQAS